MLKQIHFFRILNAGLVRICERDAASHKAKSESAPECELLQWQWITDGLCEKTDNLDGAFKLGNMHFLIKNTFKHTKS